MNDLTYKEIYSIEEHLKQFRDVEGFDILYESWMIEKKEYVNRLNTVGMTYQTYSRHDASHSEAILRQIAYFLGEERIRQLSPTDTWLLLECAYCHDLGMVVTAKDLYREFASMDQNSFDEISRKMYGSEDYDIRASWSYLEPLFKYGQRAKKNKKDAWAEATESTEKYKNLDNLLSMFHLKWYEWPMHFSKAFMILIQEYCRPKHAQMSYSVIQTEENERTYEGLIAKRLRHLIAEIAVIHTDSSENVIKKLSGKVQGHNRDYAHPRYVAELIRIGDLLDMDNNRFNIYQLAVAGNQSYSSFVHQLKHKAIKNFLVTPKKIVVEADFRTEDAREILECSSLGKNLKSSKKKSKKNHNGTEKLDSLTLKAFKELSGWLQMLRQELEFFCQNWIRIVPDGITGSCPYFEPEILLINGKSIENDILDLRYHITAKRASEIIEGAGLYDDIFVAFIRELLQNSMDATKRKVYNDVGEKIKKKFSNPLEFYRYIAQDIEKILIRIDCKEIENSQNKKLLFVIRDHGSGISYERLKGMQHIGDISDYETNEQAKKMPVWWKPTGSFGIGLQTVFYFSRMFKLKTRTEEEKILRTMRFHSTQIGGKIDVIFDKSVKKANKFGLGTEIEVKISSEIMKILQQQEQFGKNSDYFGKKIDIYKEKIEEAVKFVQGSFGLPVSLNPPEKDDDTLNPDMYLTSCFGTYFIDLSENQIVEVLKNQEKLPLEEKYHGFSCWDSNRKILIRYRWPKKMRKKSEPKIYFNEIRVYDRALKEVLRIPFFDTEVYLFNENAENFLEVNRDSFLYEKRGYIVDQVCSTHLDCLRRLLWTEENAETTVEATFRQLKSQQDNVEAIWKNDDEIGYHSSVRDYFNLVIHGKPLKEFNTDIDWFVQNEYMIDKIHDGTLNNYVGMHIERNLWLTDIQYRYVGSVYLKKGNRDETRYIVEDSLFCYMDLAITEMVCLQDIYNNYTVIYKAKPRMGQPVKMKQQDFESYLRMRYMELNAPEDNLERLLLPGIEKYRSLCVYRLLDNLGATFEKKWDSAIIMPITLQELNGLLQKSEEKDAIKLIEDKLLTKKNSSYMKIRKYIKEHGIDKMHKKQGIYETYRQLLIDVWKLLTGNLPS